MRSKCNDIDNQTIVNSPVCLYPPFLFILSNFSFVNCTNSTCQLSQCWNASRHNRALVADIPRWIPVPVQTQSTLTLFRQKRDFGITAAIILAITAAAAGATTAGIAMASTVQTAAKLNQLSSTVSKALDTQNSLNGTIKGGIMILNQRIDLVQEQVDAVWQLAQLGCEWKYSGLCVTSVPYNNVSRAANLSRSLSQYLTGNWTTNFDALMVQLRQEIVQINATRVDLSLAQGFSSWITSAFSYFKEWVGVGMFGVFCVAGCSFCLWLICRLKAQHDRDRKVIAQAFMAIDAGQSPQAWLSALKD